MALRFVLAASFVLLCAAVEEETPDAVLAGVQKTYESALVNASAAKATLEHAVEESRSVKASTAAMDEIADKILKAANHPSPTQEDIDGVHVTEHTEKHKMRLLRHEAKRASRVVKHWARQREHAQRKAGLPEHIYEGEWDKNEDFAEGMEDHVENLGDEGADHVEHIYEYIQRRFETQRDEAQRAAEEAARQAAEKAETERAAAEKASAEKAAADEVAAEPAAATSPAVQSLAAAPRNTGLANNVMSQAYVGLISCIALGAIASGVVKYLRHSAPEEASTLQVHILA